jgi:pimeloyl-ACP methyl ester carboxylesterase
MPYAQAGGIKLYYERHGRGDPLVLIPGLGTDTRLFAAVLPRLSGRNQVVLLDPRGAGRSEKPAGPYSIAEMTDDLVALMATIGIARAHVMGYSMGGKIALQLAAAHPELVDHLILGATAASPPVTRRLSRRSLMVDVIARVPLWRKVDAQPAYAFEAQRRASAAFDGRALLTDVRAPTLIIRARRDRIVPPRAVEELLAIPASSLVELPGGHLTLVLLHGRELSDAVVSFLDSAPATG